MSLEGRIDKLETAIGNRLAVDDPAHIESLWDHLVSLSCFRKPEETGPQATRRTERQLLKESGLTKKQHLELIRHDMAGIPRPAWYKPKQPKYETQED